MPEANTGNNGNTGDGNTNTGNTGGSGGSGTVDIDALVAEKVAEALKPIKTNLDSAYAARDAAQAKATQLETEKREAELKRLQDEGKHKEAYELQLKTEKEAREAAEAKNVTLTRDVDARSALTGLDFRSEKAADIAFQEITKDLVRNDKGIWVHKTGVTIKDFVASFAQHQDNAFLFKQKANTGSGSGNMSQTGSTGEKPKSLFARSQADVLAAAERGELPHQQRRR